MSEVIQCHNYCDENGNRIIGAIANCRVIFKGKNSTLTVGENFQSWDNTIQLANNCSAVIGDNVNMKGAHWNFYDDGACEIGSDSRLRNGVLNVTEHAKIILGRGFTVEQDYIIFVLPHSTIRFGEDCMVSRRVSIQSNDGHDIFDIRTGQNISSTVEISKNRNILIGSHVWIGQDSTILYGTEIGDGSIVGTRSLVKKRFPNNCVIAGNPARLIKRDVAWSRGYGDTDIGVIEKRFVRLTEEKA